MLYEKHLLGEPLPSLSGSGGPDLTPLLQAWPSRDPHPPGPRNRFWEVAIEVLLVTLAGAWGKVDSNSDDPEVLGSTHPSHHEVSESENDANAREAGPTEESGWRPV